jgi:hypothetical protein
MFNPEFEERFAGRYFGRYRGFVVDIADPKELFRVKAKCPLVMGSDEALGWALPATSAGGSTNVGDSYLPHVNDFVWLEFEGGDPAYPVWSPGPWAFRQGASMAPKHGRGKADYTDYSVRDVDNIPPTQFEGEYGHTRVFQGYDGSFLEFDGTPGKERVQLSHYSGSRYEISADGGMQEVCIASQRRFISGMHSIKSLAEERSVEGERKITIGGLTTETYGGNVSRTYNTLAESGESSVAAWAGDFTVSAGSLLKLAGAGNGLLSFTGQLAFLVGSNMQASVMETIELSASNTSYGEVPPLTTPLPSITVHGYNGAVLMKATDSTGELKEASLELNPTTLGVGSSTWQFSTIGGTVIGGQVTLDELVAVPGVANVHLGSGVREPLIKGSAFIAWLKAVLALVAAHVHPIPGNTAPVLVNPGSGIIPGSVLLSQLDVPGLIASYTVDTA